MLSRLSRNLILTAPFSRLEVYVQTRSSSSLTRFWQTFNLKSLKFLIQNRLPSIYTYREQVLAGGLVSYATNYYELFRRAATVADKILKGAKPRNLPVEQPTKFELVVNLRTAKALGLTVPPTLLSRADEVIE
jgi:ABC-type uncharacterized transport system, periplasmic component